MRFWWHYHVGFDPRRRRRLVAALRELARWEHSPVRLAALLRRRGFRALRGGRLGADHVSAMLRRYGIERGYEVTELRPRTRGECEDGIRPCPWVGCRYHLGHDVGGRGDRILEELEALPETCALDVAGRGPESVREVARLMGLPRSTVHDAEQRALERCRATIGCDEAPEGRRWPIGEGPDDPHDYEGVSAELAELKGYGPLAERRQEWTEPMVRGVWLPWRRTR